MNDFLNKIKARAKRHKKTIVLAEGEEIRTIKATNVVLKEQIADIVLLGSTAKIKQLAADNDIDISYANIIEPQSSNDFENFVSLFYEMRKNKGITEEKAREIMRDPLYFGVMLVKQDFADGMVAGAVNATSNVLRPALQILKTAPGVSLVSSFFVMALADKNYGKDGVFIYSDAGLNENPDAPALADIAISSANSFKTLVESEPTVALLSYSTKGSAKSELVNKVIKATEIAKAASPGLNLDGELQADAAIVPSIGASKAPNSKVAGHANVLIFPDLNAGNIAYKLTERLAGAEAYGPITQGILKPVNDLSRGCSADDIVGVVAITCVQAQVD